MHVVGEVGVPILSFTTSYPTSAVINYYSSIQIKLVDAKGILHVMWYWWVKLIKFNYHGGGEEWMPAACMLGAPPFGLP